MNELIFGLSVMLVGMGIVFVGLVILIGCIKLIRFVSGGRASKAEKNAAAETAADSDSAARTVAAEGIAPDVLAAITAAIAAVWEGDTGFVVRHVRRVHNAPAWNRAGREDQIYSRM